ncbi:UNKNOWN [Stylonychia lemnae]|uniref:Uncharacterized protein n=1 Tax=Stylonychia lemnae TaxID=5949 RepID=A0A078AZN6_STYLE|nr:UNKNOWN [Stylonychia lemnae]|eukprot:CDW86268.1 UNKNOWN [Stylonychia lemnae]
MKVKPTIMKQSQIVIDKIQSLIKQYINGLKSDLIKYLKQIQNDEHIHLDDILYFTEDNKIDVKIDQSIGYQDKNFQDISLQSLIIIGSKSNDAFQSQQNNLTMHQNGSLNQFKSKNRLNIKKRITNLRSKAHKQIEVSKLGNQEGCSQNLNGDQYFESQRRMSKIKQKSQLQYSSIVNTRRVSNNLIEKGFNRQATIKLDNRKVSFDQASTEETSSPHQVQDYISKSQLRRYAPIVVNSQQSG